jgi:hypothetical protein
VTHTMRRTILPVLAVAALGWCHSATAGLPAERALAAKYAPVVRLVTQPKECGHGEPYRPLDVNVLFGADTVSLRGPWNRTDLIAVGPTAAQIGKGLFEYHLDFPGNALDPGCGYEEWSRAISAGSKPTVYAHVATDPGRPGKLALQYWLYYVFNDWNNPHEGDWEMIQLNFDVPTPAQALQTSPVEVGYSQHEGAERAAWGESKLELMGGTHPVVHVAAGSHANFFDQALYLGSSASEGVGCDDTRAPAFDIRPAVQTIPSDPMAARASFPWIGFQGRWGELQRAFFNGPTGPNLKRQWTEPIQWAEEWRTRSYAIPAGGVLGTTATGFFCGAVAGGSDILRRFVHEPRSVLLVLSVLVALVLLALSRVTWRPTSPLRLARRRAWGQIIAAAGRMYRHRLGLFVGIGLLLVPISLFVAVLQTAVLTLSSIAGISNEGQGGGILVLLVVAFGTALTLLGIGLVQAATARALVEIDAGRPVGALRAYRLAAGSVVPLLGALVIAALTVLLLASSLFLLPVAIWLAVRWALIAPVIALEELSAVQALRRSGRLVEKDWLKVGSLTIVGAAVALVSGPLVGALLIILTDAPLQSLDAVAGIIYALAMPFVALTTAYVYFDTRVRAELGVVPGPDRLPAEIELNALRRSS